MLTTYQTHQPAQETKAKDNKVRLSRDVLDKAQLIAAEWGLKNARAAVEAVFRCYADAYLSSTLEALGGQRVMSFAGGGAIAPLTVPETWPLPPRPRTTPSHTCEALDVLDDLLGS